MTTFWIVRVPCLLALMCISVGAAGEDKPPRLNRFIELMESKKPAFGIFSANVSPRTGANLADAGLDFVLIDMEHSPYDVTRLEGYLLGMLNKAEIAQHGLRTNTVPIVRIPSTGRELASYMIKQTLDVGAMGVMVPHVETAEQALAAVQACRYPQQKGSALYEPKGSRGVAYSWAARYWGLPGEEYARRADLWPLNPRGELVLWVMIESAEGVKNCDAIARTPGVGALFIGPSDLAFSLGVPRNDPAVETAIEEVVQVAKKAGIPLGIYCMAADAEKRLAQGFQFLALGMDTGLPGDVKATITAARKANP